MVGLFATDGGLFYGGGFHFLGVKLLGVICVIAWVVVSMTIIFKIVDKTIGLRVSAEIEIDGLDIHEHGLASAYSGFEITDISKTSVCPLCKVMRKELKARGIRKLKVLYSKESPVDVSGKTTEEDSDVRRCIPGSISFVPPVAGLLLAGEVVRELTGVK